MKKIIDLEVTKRKAEETTKGINYFLVAKSPKTSKGSVSEVTVIIRADSSQTLDGFPLDHRFSIQINNPQKSMKDFGKTDPSESTEENQSEPTN